MHYEPAPVLRRLAARVLDLIFCLGLTFVVAVPVGLLLVVPASFVLDDSARSVFTGLAAALCYFIAYIGLEVFLLIRRDGQTLGKGLLGLRVVSTHNIRQIPARSAVIRMSLIFAPFVLLWGAGVGRTAPLDALAYVGLLSFLVSLVLAAVPQSGERRALHDLAAGTRVVRAVTRKIDIGNDFRMVLPGKIDMTKRV